MSMQSSILGAFFTSQACPLICLCLVKLQFPFYRSPFARPGSPSPHPRHFAVRGGFADCSPSGDRRPEETVGHRQLHPAPQHGISSEGCCQTHRVLLSCLQGLISSGQPAGSQLAEAWNKMERRETRLSLAASPPSPPATYAACLNSWQKTLLSKEAP